MITDNQEYGLRLAETLIMAELFGRADEEIIKEAKEISELTLKEPIHITKLELTHRYYCLAKELNRRGYSIPCYDFIEDLKIQELRRSDKNL